VKAATAGIFSALSVVLSLGTGGVCAHAAVTREVMPGDYLKFVASAKGHIAGFTSNYPDGSTPPSPLYGGGGGGEFKFLVGYDGQFPDDPDDTADYLITFCAERFEFIISGAVYQVADLVYEDSTRPGFDFAKWIFWGYTSDQENGNVIPDRVPGSSNPLDSDLEAKKVQDAIWKALGQTSRHWITAQEYWDWYSSYQSDPLWPLVNDGDSAVAVLLTTSGWPAQDQWVFINRPGWIIPEPAAATIWVGLGLLAAVAAAARYQRAARAG